jgi:hypothetical protein
MISRVRYVRAPALHSFYAKVYHIYRDNCFPPVDAEKALRLIIGYSPERSMQIKGPVSSIQDISPSAVGFREFLLAQFRAMVDRLTHVVVSMPDSVLLNL